MSIGSSAIRALLTDGSRSAMRDINREFLTDEEVRAYDFVHRFIRMNSRLPSIETMTENGIGLSRAREPLTYYVRRLQERAVFDAITANHPALIEAMENRNMEGAMRAIQSLHADTRQRSASNALSSVQREAQDLLEALPTPRDPTSIIPFGYAPLDEATDGMQGGDVNVLASRPNMGKSFFLLNSMMAGWRSIHSPMVVTMEMRVQQLTTRLMGMDSGINTKYIRRRELSTWGRNRLAETVRDFQLLPPMHFVSGHAISGITDVELLVGDLEPDAVYIDAAYLLKADEFGHKRSRWENIAEMMSRLTALADQSGIPFYITVQLNKSQKSNSSSLDGAADSIAGADNILQDAAVLVGLAPGEGVDAQTRRQHMLLKNREGRKGFSWYTKFEFDPVMDFSLTTRREEVVRNQLRRSMI